jgi:cyclopropane-fatty-acyl-phospholipid synthase
VRVTAVTISQEQYKFATERVAREGLSDLIEIRLQDYRHITGQFDKIASIEMLEAVGDKYPGDLLREMRRGVEARGPAGLPDDHRGRLPAPGPAQRRGLDSKTHLPRLAAAQRRPREPGDQPHERSLHARPRRPRRVYAKTLRLWFERFNAKLAEVKAQGFDERFIRKWNYYLQYCEAAFATRNISVVQAVYTRPNNTTLHRSF